MQKVLLSFSRKYRQEQRYVGHFWQGRYLSKSVTTDIGMQFFKYVHENPVKARKVSQAQEYKFSSVYKYFDLINEEMENVIKVVKYGDTSAGSRLLTL